MARILPEKDSVPWQWARYAILGIVMGIVYFLIMLMLERYVVSPIACGSGSPAQCLESRSIAGGISSILVGVAGLFGAIRYLVPRPLLVIAAATILTFGLGTWISGLFWLEAMGWSALIYLLAVLLFCGVYQFRNVIASLAVTVVILITERIVLTF